MKTIAIYAGRFQPFHKGHYTAYKALVSKFGQENVFIATSDNQDPDKNPFTFDEKKHIMSGIFNIPSEYVVKAKNPYRPEEILSKYNPSNTVFVTALSKNDKGDVNVSNTNSEGGSYFLPYDDHTNGGLLPFKRNGYFLEIPVFKINGEPLSASRIRDKLGNPAINSREKVDFFKLLYGKYNPSFFKMMRNAITKSKTRLQHQAPIKEEPKPKSVVKAKTGNKRDLDLTKTIRNPHTSRSVQLRVALQYDKSHPAYKQARKMFTQGGSMRENFHPILIENALVNQFNSLVDEFIVGEGDRETLRILPTDEIDEIERKCTTAYRRGVFFFPLLHALKLAQGGDDFDDKGNPLQPDPRPPGVAENVEVDANGDPLQPDPTPDGKKTDIYSKDIYGAVDDNGDLLQPDPRPDSKTAISEEKSSTERVRRYYKRHPEKVRKHLKATQKDRVARNRDRKKAEDRNGKAAMKDKDVHHPNGPHGGKTQVVPKDHGRDKKPNK